MAKKIPASKAKKGARKTKARKGYNPQTEKITGRMTVQATEFRFLTNTEHPTVAILEVDTEGTPVRIAFNKQQLADLSNRAALAAAKVDAPAGTSSLFA